MKHFTFTHCTNCGPSVPCVLKTNFQGGRFYGCSRFATHDCRWTASPTTGHESCLAGAVSRASRRRSQTVSLRLKVVARAVAMEFTREEVEAYMQQHGVVEAARLLEVAA